MTSEIMAKLVGAAVAAPSGDNTQPWRFETDSASGRIAIYLDETRDPSPMNSGQRMARIALGSAIENILVVAGQNGWQADLEPAPPGGLAMVKVTAAELTPTLSDDSVMKRVTSRRVYDGRKVPDETLRELREKTPPLDGVRTEWIVDRDRINSLASLMSRSDTMMFGEPSMLRAFLDLLRVDSAPDAVPEFGLSLASLEATLMDRLGIRLIKRLPGWVLKTAGIHRTMGKHTKTLGESSSCLCVFVAPDNRQTTDLTVGRCMQRAWLALTAGGMATQPMMSGMVIDAVLELGSRDLVAAMGRDKLVAIRDEFRTQIPECQDGRLAAMLRGGYAPDVTGRTGRMPLDMVASETTLQNFELQNTESAGS